MDKYEELKCIGRGSYGSAHLVAERGSGARYVVKKIPMELLTEKERQQSFREVELLAKLKHPNVVEYRENFCDGNVLHIVMAYCDGGDLAGRIRERTEAAGVHAQPSAYFSISQILDWFVQMAMAIKYLHEQRVLHRDLKTSNIFLTTENVIKLGDFGIAKTLDSTLDQAKTVVGTPYYMSPEVCESKPYSYASDIWALGCVLYEMVALKHAFDAPNILTLILKIVQQDFAPIPPHYGEDMLGLLRRLLDKTPERRPTMEQIFTMPYIRNHMQGFIASGGSLRMNPEARRTPGTLKRRVHPKSTNRRSSGDRRRLHAVAAASANGSAVPPPPLAAQWMPIVPHDFDDDQVLLDRGSDMELLETSISEEPQLNLRLPERSITPEPLVVVSADSGKDGVTDDVANHKSADAALPVAPRMRNKVAAWASESSDMTVVADPGRSDNIDNDVEEEDMHSRFQAEAEELMNPNFQSEYSEECMDSLQIYYGSQLKAHRRSIDVDRRADRMPDHDQRSSGKIAGHGVPLKARQPASLQRNRSRSTNKTNDGSPRRSAILGDAVGSGDGGERWGRRRGSLSKSLGRSVDELSLRNEAVSGSEDIPEDGDAAPASWSESGILRALELDADSSGSDSDVADSSLGDDEYEAEENFYSDDSDFYQENDTQYSDDFEDLDAEVIEYANEEFMGDEDGPALLNYHYDGDEEGDERQLQEQDNSMPAGGAHSITDTAATSNETPSTPVTSPSRRRSSKPSTEVQWVMRTVAQSLLESRDDVHASGS